MSISVEFDFDPDDFENEIRREVEREAIHQFSSTFERLGRSHAGRPKADIRAELVRLGIDPTPELVEAIQNGTRIEVEFEWR